MRLRCCATQKHIKVDVFACLRVELGAVSRWSVSLVVTHHQKKRENEEEEEERETLLLARVCAFNRRGSSVAHTSRTEQLTVCARSDAGREKKFFNGYFIFLLLALSLLWD